MSVTPDFIGQVYKDTNTGNIWRANSTTPGDWTLEVQNSLVKWNPRNINLGEVQGFITLWDGSSSLAGITSLSIDFATVADGIYISTAPDLVSVDFPSLTDCISPAEFSITDCALLMSVSAPMLSTVSGNTLQISSNPSLTLLNLSSLITAGTALRTLSIHTNSSLVELSLPSLVPDNGISMIFQGNALDAASVNGILARCVANAAYVSGSIDFFGGTNAAPSGQGILDVATLIGRGVVVTTN